MKDLPPTPSKFHYIFNLRDLSRIYNGLCLTTPDRFETPDQFLRVWRNEVTRVVFDRLISAADRDVVHVSVSQIRGTALPSQMELIRTSAVTDHEVKFCLVFNCQDGFGKCQIERFKMPSLVSRVT